MKEFYYVFESETVGTFAVLDSSYESAKETAEEVAADAEYMYDAFEWEVDQAGLDVF